MRRNPMFALPMKGVATMIAVIAVAIALVACGGDTQGASAAELRALDAKVTAQSAEIQALAAQVGSLQPELAAASAAALEEVAALQVVVDGMAMEDDDEPAEDYSDDIRSLESDIGDLSESIAENVEEIDAIPNAMSDITTALISDHADEHDGLEGAIQKAFDEHGVSHDALQTTLEDALNALHAALDADDDGKETASLQERLDWLEAAVAPAYTRAYVEEAILRYNRGGRQATLDYYNTTESVSGDLYLFVLDGDYKLIVHPTIPANIGLDIRGPLGTDITGKNYGTEFVSVDSQGKWVDYVFLNPAANFRYERKHSWIVRHDGLIFGSGYYEPLVASKDNPATYTRAFVEEAIARYEADGLNATVAYYNSPESIDGQWYVFIGGENDVLIAHAAIPENVGKRYDEIISPDGYPAGAQVAAAAVEGGKWTSYTYLNPATGNAETKHSWVVRHDGLIFGSGWYEEGPSKDDRDAFTQAFVQRALNLYDDLGLEGTVAYYNSPESIDGQWYVFIIDEDDNFLAHAATPERVGTDVKVLTDANGYAHGQAISEATEEGGWLNYTRVNPVSGMDEPKHSWVIRHDGLIFGSGYYE